MRQLQVLLVFLLLLFLIACGGGSSSNNTNVTITVSPTTASVATTQNQQFTATVTGGSTTAVVWEVNGVPFGNASTTGTINSAGLYTAPATVPNPATVTVAAVASADTTKTADATVTITQGANLAISPSSVTVDAGAQQQFTVTSNGQPVTGIDFSLTCKSPVQGDCGTVTSDGLYTAPLTPPPGNVILTATLVQSGNTYSTSATITVVPSTQSTAGQYAFTLSGTDNGASLHAAGSVSFDGKGNITGGTEDVNRQGTLTTVTITGGTYTFNQADGRVTANVQTDHGNITWYIVLANRSHGFIEYAGAGISASGTMNLQDAQQFTLAAVSGNYTFRVAGTNLAPAQSLAEVGAFTANGSGSLTSGLLDANNGGSLSNGQSLSGSLAAPSSSSGRGTMTVTSGFGSQSFAYYVVDATQIKLVEIDGLASTAGDVLKQSDGPYATGDFHGNVALILDGEAGGTALGIGGMLSLGSGDVTGGTIDSNLGGTFTGGQAVTSGSYTVADPTTGRTTGTITYGTKTLPVVLYPVSDTQFNVLGVNTNEVESGQAMVATGGNGTDSTLMGNYALNLTGVVGTTPEDVTGTLSANGGGVFTGTLDITNGGANTALQPSPYSISATSTTTLMTGFANFSSVGFDMYVIDSTEVFFLENDSRGVLTGVMQIQQ